MKHVQLMLDIGGILASEIRPLGVGAVAIGAVTGEAGSGQGGASFYRTF
jgi:hypothetical protein